MHPIKLIWAMRAVVYKLSFGKIGFRSYIGKPLYIEGRQRIAVGSRTRIFPGMRVEAIGKGRVIIGSNTVIEQRAHIISMDDDLVIGNDVTIGPNVFITNVNHKYEDVSKSVMDQGHVIRKTKIGDGCFIGYGAAIQAGTVLGKHCIVGSNSVVKGVFPDYCVIVGCPGRIIKKYNPQTKKWEKV
ncbi:MAG: acyltransferase [Oscillospiraceae bacterium]|nr:acyltransferase [Oscillospiraceae bacterium]